ncbi:hypothetical protein TWF718_007853 [Orbilia javanica]|uniref:Uncharacterized protein n=1 Tax=Orbilia javanica TaxID=47235 RepID=A0AAN8N060_9PEZI
MPSLSPVIPNADQGTTAVYISAGKDLVLVLNSLPQGIDLADYPLFDQKSIFIYAEKVTVSKDTVISGKNVTICCTDFSVTGDNPVKLSVSGTDGAATPTKWAPKASAAVAGKAGTNAGSLKIVVRNGLDSLLSSGKLTLEANGGTGSNGQSTEDDAWPADGVYGVTQWPPGGAGGDAGNGGAINLYYNAPEALQTTTMKRILNDDQNPWTFKVQNLSDFSKTLQAAGFPLVADAAATLTAFSAALGVYFDYASSLTIAADFTRIIINFAPTGVYPNANPPSAGTVSTATLMKAVLANALSGSKPPDYVLISVTTAIQQYNQKCQEWLEKGQSAEQALQDQLQSLFATMLGASGHASDGIKLDPANQAILTLFSASSQAKDTKLKALCSANQGKAGSGGINSNWGNGDPWGHPVDGKSGTAGSVSATNYDFLNGAVMQNFPVAYAFPEQCQMMLDTADRLFCSPNASDRAQAAGNYKDILLRLSFFPGMQKAASSKTSSLILDAYKALEDTQGLTVGAIDTLNTVYNTATTRLNAYTLGCDMFGNAANWVPRLSPTYYKTRVNSLLTKLQKLETLLNTVGQAAADQAARQDKINAGISASNDAQNDADQEIDTLCSPNGTLAIFGSKIQNLTQSLYTIRGEVEKAMSVVEKDMQSYWNFQGSDIYNALCTLVQSHDALTVIRTLGEFGYNAATTITDDQGGTIKTKYLIKQMIAFQGDIKALDMQVKGLSDGTIDVDAPGAPKLLATKESIDALVSQYTNSIPEQHRKDLTAQINRLIKATLERNEAVVNYNAALQQYSQALGNREAAIAQSKVWGTQKVTLDPALPSVFYALNKLRRDMQLNILQNMWYEGRAFAFWAVLPFDKIKSTSPSALKGSKDLGASQDLLDNQFDNFLTQWANYTWSLWPAKGDNTQAGLLYKLSDDELKTLLVAGTDSSNLKSFSTQIKFQPNVGIFAGNANVRIRQIRLWLPGAKLNSDQLGRQLLKVSILHGGSETLQLGSNDGLGFLHDPVKVTWQYDAAIVHGVADITNPKAAFGTEALENDFQGGTPDNNTKAAIGPFTTWTFTVNESDNAGLDFSGVTEAYIEFWGRAIPPMKN